MDQQTRSSHKAVKARLLSLYEELLGHDGFGEFRVEFRILKRGQREVIVHCGKQYRYVVNVPPPPDRAGDLEAELPDTIASPAFLQEDCP